MSTIVYRYSDKYKPNKTKGYRFRVRRDGYARDLKTLDKKPPIINDINKTDIKKIKRRRKVPGWSKTGSVISKRFVWSGKESASRVLSDLSHMGLNSDYRSDIELTLNHYLCNLKNLGMDHYFYLVFFWKSLLKHPVHFLIFQYASNL